MDDLDRVAALADPVRRRLYDYVAAAGGPVDRDQAAEGVGIGRPLAAHHLDRLVASGLLEPEFRRRSGRSGPGAGRPAKFYRRPLARDVSVQLPARSYDLAAEILAEGVERDAEAPANVVAAARRRGEAIGAGAGPHVLQLLSDQGYEPVEAADGAILMRNCPFHALVEDHRDLTCGMNHALLEGALDAAGVDGYTAELRPEDGRCCVVLRPRGAPSDG
jgi:predicted ArsR family transcriptional regulator